MPLKKSDEEQGKTSCAEWRKYCPGRSPALLWLTVLLFLTVSSLTFAVFFEFPRYLELIDPPGDSLTFLDSQWVFAGIIAKSFLFFLPLLLTAGCLILLGLTKTAICTVILYWGMTFLFMTADLVATSFRGVHIWDYLPNIGVGGENAFAWTWRMVGERIKAEALVVIAFCALAAPSLFFAVRALTEKLVRWCPSLVSKKLLTSFTALFVISSAGILVAPPCLRETLYASMPIPNALSETLERYADALQILASRNKFDCTSTMRTPKPEIESQVLSPGDERYVANMIQNGLQTKPPDPSAAVGKPGLPNLILIIVESLRSDAVSPSLMKALDEWSRRGLRAERHYSGSNATHLGFFSLLYGRIPVAYGRTLDKQIPSQMAESLRNSGYMGTCLTDELTPFLRMLDMLSPLTCDTNIEAGRFTFNTRDVSQWPDADRSRISKALDILSTPSGNPQFVLLYLLSSHHRYYFPPEFEVFKETHTLWKYLDSPIQIQNHRNRYANSMLFLDHELTNFVKSVDLNRNIIIITGDHGQSMREDGVFTHGSRRSDIQMRVPLIMVGPGVPRKTISTATVHYDVLPTLLHALSGREIPIMDCDGRDLLSDMDLPDKVLVLPIHHESLEPLLITGRDRFLFKLASPQGKSPELEFAGMVDELGRYKLKLTSAERRRRSLPLEGSSPQGVSH